MRLHLSYDCASREFAGADLKLLTRRDRAAIELAIKRWREGRAVGHTVEVALPAKPNFVWWAAKGGAEPSFRSCRVQIRNRHVIDVEPFANLGKQAAGRIMYHGVWPPKPITVRPAQFLHDFGFYDVDVQNVINNMSKIKLAPGVKQIEAREEDRSNTEEPRLGATKSAWDFQQRLIKRGYALIGSGAYSYIYAKPGTGKVIKVCRTVDRWVTYIKWAHENGFLGLFAPNVTSLRIYNADKEHKRFYVAVVERLEGTIHNTWMQDRFEQARSLHSQMHRLCVYGEADEGLLHLEGKARGAAVFALAFHVKFGRGDTDLHSNNWMVRVDGSLVLTDPLAGRTVERNVITTMRRFKRAPMHGADQCART